MTEPILLADACASLTELWSPRVVGQVNDQYLKVARVQGEFPWHAHAHEDELFLVLKGALTIGRTDEDGGPLTLQPGEVFIVPKGVRHNTSAAEETWIALIETVTTKHSGDEMTDKTRSLEEQLRPIEACDAGGKGAPRAAVCCLRFRMTGCPPARPIRCCVCADTRTTVACTRARASSSRGR